MGDVQGCADELVELVARARAQFGDGFELWVAGDVVNRGPDNRRALELVRGFVEAGRGRYVLGNHEVHLLHVALGLRDLGRNDSIGDVLGAPDASEWVDWLLGRALVERGTIAGQPFAMVHASSHPDWTLAALCEIGDALHARLAVGRTSARAFLATPPEADPLRDALGRLTRCRSVTDSGAWSSADPTPTSARLACRVGRAPPPVRPRLRPLGAPGPARGARRARPRHRLCPPRPRPRRLTHGLGPR